MDINDYNIHQSLDSISLLSLKNNLENKTYQAINISTKSNLVKQFFEQNQDLSTFTHQIDNQINLSNEQQLHNKIQGFLNAKNCLKVLDSLKSNALNNFNLDGHGVIS